MQTLTNPALFFRQFDTAEPRVRRAYQVVFFITALSLIASVLVVLPIAKALSDFRQLILIAATLLTIVSSVGGWLVTGLLIRWSAGVHSQAWAVSAYSMTPNLITLPLLIVVAIFFAPTLPPLELDLENPEVISQQLEVVSSSYSESLLGFASQISAAYVATVWQLLLIFVGVKERVGIKKALLATSLVALFRIASTFVVWFLS